MDEKEDVGVRVGEGDGAFRRVKMRGVVRDPTGNAGNMGRLERCSQQNGM